VSAATADIDVAAKESIRVGELLDTIAEATGLRADDPGLLKVRLHVVDQFGRFADLEFDRMLLSEWDQDRDPDIVFLATRESDYGPMVAIPAGTEGIADILWDAHEAAWSDGREWGKR